jgi:hypothetical protein
MTAKQAESEENQRYLRRIDRVLRPLSRPSSQPAPYEEGVEEARHLARQFREALKKAEEVEPKKTESPGD